MLQQSVNQSVWDVFQLNQRTNQHWDILVHVRLQIASDLLFKLGQLFLLKAICFAPRGRNILQQ